MILVYPHPKLVVYQVDQRRSDDDSMYLVVVQLTLMDEEVSVSQTKLNKSQGTMMLASNHRDPDNHLLDDDGTAAAAVEELTKIRDTQEEQDCSSQLLTQPHL